VYSLDSDGYNDTRDSEVREDFHAQALLGADTCPEQAIRVSESAGRASASSGSVPGLGA
jgi:ferredoxin